MEGQRGLVSLVSVDDDVLDQLIRAATTSASPNEVTPPLTPGAQWTPIRVEWLKAYHRDRRRGLDGPCREATWAVVVDDWVVGSVRMKLTEQDGVVETGLWLTSDVGGKGLGTASLAAALDKARELGSTHVCAETLVDNIGALSALRRLGFTLEHGEGQSVRAITSL
ncbi:MAG: GNAT family N-acetyltransferase [Ornithinimicrobium sp.]